jgi:CBS domain containing-hemolysin-like protein
MVRVPEATTADRCLALLRESQAHLVVVEDAAHRLVGLLALEDLLAAVMGHFGDELKTVAAVPAPPTSRSARMEVTR